MSSNFTGLGGDEMSLLGHDARSHLRSAIIRGQLLSQRPELSETVRTELELILESNRCLESLVGRSVFFATVAQTPELFVKFVSLKTLVQGLILEYQGEFQRGQGTLAVGVAPDGSVPAGLHWIVKELLENSLRFRGDRPLAVEIDFSHDAETLTIRVQDNGIGFPEDCAQEIFLPYRRLHGRDVYPSNGLGLSIASRIAAICAGELSAVPHSPGAAFVVRWPIET